MIPETVAAIKAGGKQYPSPKHAVMNDQRQNVGSQSGPALQFHASTCVLASFVFCFSFSLLSLIFHLSSSSPHSTFTTRGTSTPVLPTRPARHLFPHSGQVSSSAIPSPIPSPTPTKS